MPPSTGPARWRPPARCRSRFVLSPGGEVTDPSAAPTAGRPAAPTAGPAAATTAGPAAATAGLPAATADIERIFRAEYGRAVAVLVRLLGDIDLAEEAVQDAFTVAVTRWPAEGLPPRPAGWIITTARHRAIDRFRREA